MKKIAIVTATRAEYGLLSPLIRRVSEDKETELDLIITGTHLSKKHGYTIEEILRDGFSDFHTIPILENGNTPYDISVTVANATKGFAQCFRDDRPDMAVILGDRTEMLGVAVAAMNERIPIAHIHGGEVTEGAVDDCVRHALTKMSYLHFTATEAYRNRVIQLGENSNRVFAVGSLGTDNILSIKLLGENSLRRAVGIPEGIPYAVMTFHPVTLEGDAYRNQVHELCQAMKESRLFYLITMTNADTGGDYINQVITDYAAKHDNAILAGSLGAVKYLSALKYASFVLGNSSSGILEAPVLGTPTINIGDRQKGRLMADTVINCNAEKESIMRSIDKAKKMPHIATRMYGDGSASEKILSIQKRFLFAEKIELKKGFFDIVNSAEDTIKNFYK